MTSRIAFATATPIAMIAPMNDCTLIVVPVAASMSTTPARTAGTVETTTNASRSDWKLAASRRKITTTATTSPAAMFLSVSRIGAICPRTVTVAPRGGVPARRDRLVDAPRHAAQVFADDVGRQRDHALTVEPVVFADDCRVLDAGDVAEQRVDARRPR